MFRALVAALPVFAFCVQAAVAAPATSPVGSEGRLAALTPEQRAFVSDAHMLALFHLSPEKLSDILGARDDAQARAYVAALMQVVADSRFQQGKDQDAIPLNPKATAFNISMTLKPALFDTYRRDPGPISLDHYMFERGGIPTFAHAPVAIRAEDLKAGKVDVAFVGVPMDFSTGYRDAAHGPMVLRGADSLVGTDVYTGIDPATVLRLADYGNIAIDYMSVERSVAHVRTMVGDMARAHTIPFIVGGDHALMYPDVAAMSDVYGRDRVGVVQLDAHYEGEAANAHTISDMQSVRRLLSDHILDGRHLVQIGLRGGEATSADLERLRAQGVRMHTMGEIEHDGWQEVMRRSLSEVRDGTDYLFVSFDLSVLDPVYATGVGRPVPNGLTMREVVPLVRELCAQKNVVGFEVLDPAPIMDATYKTAQNANYIMHSCLAGVAQRHLMVAGPSH
ncbi:agmatinase family protein [Gluconacetobacter sp. Hr-1-5]|uniref:agmatinase family protein n=1 Tax=Gluconacetobacter sp. Hr-1-5 TaxID=3395370 RepID=UPI003B51B893